MTDLDAIDAAIRIFDPSVDTGAFANRQYPPLHAVFRGEMMRIVLEALRTGEKPVTSRRIAATVMDGPGLNKDDPKIAAMIRKRTIACMNKLKARGPARDVRIEGEFKG